MSEKTAFDRLKNRVCSVALTGLVLFLGFTPGAALAQHLSFDNDHDLLVLPDCMFAVRYNNKTFVPVKAKMVSTEAGRFLDRPVEKSLQIGEDYSKMKSGGGGERLIIECYKTGKIGRLSINRFNKEFKNQNKVKVINLTYDRVAKETGVSKSTLSGIKAVQCFEVIPKDGSTDYNLFAFTHGDHVTMFARLMREGSKGFDDSPPVIISQVSLAPGKDLKGNVSLD